MMKKEHAWYWQAEHGTSAYWKWSWLGSEGTWGMVRQRHMGAGWGAPSLSWKQEFWQREKGLANEREELSGPSLLGLRLQACVKALGSSWGRSMWGAGCGVRDRGTLGALSEAWYGFPLVWFPDFWDEGRNGQVSLINAFLWILEWNGTFLCLVKK